MMVLVGLLRFDRIEPYRNKEALLLACPFDFAHGWLMPRLGELCALHGRLEVWLMSEHDVNAIDRIDVDLVVSRKPLHGEDVESVPLLGDRGVAICGARLADKLRSIAFPKVLDRAPLLFLESAPEWGGLLPAPGAKTPRRRAATIQDKRLLLDAVEHELGIACVSEVLAADSPARGPSVRLAQVPVQARAGLWLMRSRLTPRTPVANRVFDWLLAQAA